MTAANITINAKVKVELVRLSTAYIAQRRDVYRLRVGAQWLTTFGRINEVN